MDPQRAQINYLLRRAGFGASKTELDDYQGMGLGAAIDLLVEFDKADNGPLESRLAALNLDLTKTSDIQRWWLVRMVATRRPLQEKMVLFWHGLLTSGISRVGRVDLMWRQNELFRQQALGNFGVLLKAISRDPAMLIWLDSQSNKKAAPNENFARELMELFSMGVGNYTEQDVRESARAFTGYFLGPKGFIFTATQHDNGNKTFLGRTGNLNGDDVIDIIVQHPATARYIAWRLFTFFAYDDPEPTVLAPFEKTFTDTKGDIKAVVRQILTSPAFYSQRAYRSHPKSPIELAGGMLRTMGIQTDGAGMAALIARMGQTIFDPPNVAGWPGKAAWINSSTLLERVNFANSIVSKWPVLLPSTIPYPRALDYYLELLVDGTVSKEERAVLDNFFHQDLRGVQQDAALRSLTYVLLSSPAYQMA